MSQIKESLMNKISEIEEMEKPPKIKEPVVDKQLEQLEGSIDVLKELLDRLQFRLEKVLTQDREEDEMKLYETAFEHGSSPLSLRIYEIMRRIELLQAVVSGITERLEI